MKRIALIAVVTALASCTVGLSYIPDDPNNDHWQTPAETLARGGGDCEDQAILYWSQHRADWLVHGTADGKGHVWVVDSTQRVITFTTAPGTVHIPDVYFNETCYHLPMRTDCGNARHIIKWDNVLKRMGE